MANPAPMQKPDFTFEPETHTYRLEGRVLVSVTQVLNEWREAKVYGKRFLVHTTSGAAIDGEVMDNAATFGKAVHEGAKLILTGEIDWNTVDEALIPPLMEFMRWTEDYKVKPVHVEEPMYSERHGVAGTPDLIGTVNGFRHLDITDIKTGLVNEAVGPQVAGYEIIFREREKYRKPIVRHELILPRDGSPYRFNALTNNQDGPFFLSRLFQWQYLNAK